MAIGNRSIAEPIYSFTEKVWVYALSYDLLFPSDVNETQRFEDKGSLNASIDMESVNFKVTAKTAKLFKDTHYLRRLARQVAFIAISILISPIGAVYHGLAAAGYYVSGKKDLSKEHKKASGLDVGMSIIGGALGGITTFCIHRIYRLIMNKPATLAWLEYLDKDVGWKINFHLIGIYTFFLMPIFCNWDIGPFSILLNNKGESDGINIYYRTGLEKTIYLKKHFGVVSTKGYLLSYNPIIDSETEHSGSIHNLCTKLAQEIIAKLKKGNNQFFQDPHFVENAKSRLVKLGGAEGTLPFIFFMFGQVFQIKRHDGYSEWKKELDRLLKKFKDVYPMRFAHETRIEFNPYFKPSDWQEVQMKILGSLPDVPSNLPDEIKAFEKRVRDLNHDPKYILDLSQNETTDQGYKRLALIIHPDKIPSEYKQNDNVMIYYGALFNLLCEAKNQA